MRRRFPFRRLLAALAVPLVTAWVGYAQPALHLDALPDGQVRLRWASQPSGYTLEAATDLVTANFAALAQTPVPLGDEWTVTLRPPMSAGCRRLASDKP